MRLHLLTAVASFSAFALAQVDLSNLPQCARACVGNTIATSGCNAIDVGCICRASGLIAGLACCVSKTCDAADQAATIQFADNICKPFNVNLPQTASCASGASSVSPTSGGLASGSGSGSATASSASASATSAAASSSPSSSPSASATSAAASSAAAAAATSSGASAASSGAAATMGVGLGAMVAGMGMLAAL